MRIVYVVPFCPYPAHSGSTMRIWSTLCALSQRNTVDLIIQDARPPDDGMLAPLLPRVRSLTFVPHRRRTEHRPLMAAAQWAAVCDAVRYPPSYLQRYRSEAVVERVNALLADGGANWLLCDTQLSGQIALSPHLTPVRRALCLYDVYDPLFRRKVAATPRGPYQLKVVVDWLKARHYERRMMRQFDLLIVVSANDQRLVSAHVHPERVVLVPNGVDTEYFRPLAHRDGGRPSIPGPWQGARSQAPKVLFVGSLAYEPNQDAVRYFLHEVWPLVRRHKPEARFVAAGAHPPAWLRATAERDHTIHVPGTVDDVRPLYDQARVVVAPLRLGAGTKLKVLEALAMGVPVVTTPQGCAGLDVQDRRHVLVGATREQFAAHVVTTMNDRAMASWLARNGRTLVEQRYSWPTILAAFEKKLHQASVREPHLQANRVPCWTEADGTSVERVTSP